MLQIDFCEFLNDLWVLVITSGFKLLLLLGLISSIWSLHSALCLIQTVNNFFFTPANLIVVTQCIWMLDILALKYYLAIFTLRLSHWPSLPMGSWLLPVYYFPSPPQILLIFTHGDLLFTCYSASFMSSYTLGWFLVTNHYPYWRSYRGFKFLFFTFFLHQLSL